MGVPHGNANPASPSCEYKVIHLNVSDEPSQGKRVSREGSIVRESTHFKDVGPGVAMNSLPFSAEYLFKEFPSFYSQHAALEQEGNATPPFKSPAEQLQEFLNILGCEGWHLLGIFPVGIYQMLIFSRQQQPR